MLYMCILNVLYVYIYIYYANAQKLHQNSFNYIKTA